MEAFGLVVMLNVVEIESRLSWKSSVDKESTTQSRDRFDVDVNKKNDDEERRKRQRKKWTDYDDISSDNGDYRRDRDDLSKSEKKRKKKARYVIKLVVLEWIHITFS